MTLGGGRGPSAYWLVHFHFPLGNELRRADSQGRPREWSGGAAEWSGVEWRGGGGAAEWSGVEWRGGGGAVAGRGRSVEWSAYDCYVVP